MGQRKGYSPSPETRAKLSIAKKGKPSSMLGKKHSEATKLKIGKANKGTKHSILFKQKCSERNAGKKLSEITKKRMSLGKLNNKNRFGTRQPESMKLKLSNDRKGEKHWNWKDGATALSQIIRRSLEYRNWRVSIFIRDNKTCVLCGSKEKIQADHIKPFAMIIQKNNIKTFEEAVLCKELWDIINGRTLCNDCHKKTDTYSWKTNKLLIKNV